MEIYQNNPSLNQSRLKKILIHPKAFLSDTWEGDKLPKESLLIGNAVDCLITEPDKFEDLFLIENNKFNVKGMYKSFIEELFLNEWRMRAEVDAISEEDLFEMAFQKSTSENTKFKIENFIADFQNGVGTDYYAYLKMSREKYVLTQEQLELSHRIVESLKGHDFTSSYFKDAEVVYQLEIFWHYQGVQLKSKLDMVVIDHNQKTIRPIDIKTTEYLGSFKNVFYMRRYDFQATCYTEALKQWIGGRYADYTVLPFRFLVESSKYPGTPLVFEPSESTLYVGLKGGYVDKQPYDGLEQAINRWKWHTENDLWDYRMEEYENQGVIRL